MCDNADTGTVLRFRLKPVNSIGAGGWFIAART
jgi:hypothetical protein